jgi:AraC family transcriptional regulator, L-rhamnose operon regulatory protein RhaS
MKRFNSFHSINVFKLELEKWEYELHNHNFYELIYVEQGRGEHMLNGISYAFKKDDVFLLTPNDAHEFVIEKRVKFIYLKFTEQVFLEKLNTHKKTHWENALRNVLTQFENTDSSIVSCEEDKANIFSLLKIMLYEFSNKALYNNEVVIELFGSLMAIITRNLNQKKVSPKKNDKEKERINSILTYIRINAFDNNKMDIKNMASQFYMSPNYISIFVKKHSGLSIQQHIIHAKVKSAEKLLKQKRFTINEIAERLGFNDASHFNKIFKKYKNVSPSSFVG